LKPWDPAQSTAPNKWDFDDAEIEHLSKNGITPEILERVVSDFNPANYGTQQRQWYESVVTKPTIPDEKRIRNARIAASIGDALGSIVEMAAVGGGALAKERRYEDSALGRTETRQKELQDIYLQQLARYENGLYDAGMRDILRGMDQHRQERDQLGNVLGTKRKLDQDQAQFEAELEAAAAREAQRQKNEDRRFKETQRENDARIANDKARTAIARAAEARLNNSGNGKEKAHQIVISANPNDPQAAKDALGNLVRTVDVSTEELNNYYRMAIANKEFREAHPELNLPALTDTATPDDSLATILGSSSGAAKHNAAEMANIAAIYAKEKYYDPQWTSPPAAAPVYRPPYYNSSPSWMGEGKESDYDDQFIE
jgi:hypothetical protein